MDKEDVQHYGVGIAVAGAVGLLLRAIFRGVVDGQSEFPGAWADAITSFPNSAVVGWLIFGGAAIAGLIAYLSSRLDGNVPGGRIAMWTSGGLVAFGLVPAAIAFVVFIVVWLFWILVILLIFGFIAAFLMALRG